MKETAKLVKKKMCVFQIELVMVYYNSFKLTVHKKINIIIFCVWNLKYSTSILNNREKVLAVILRWYLKIIFFIYEKCQTNILDCHKLLTPLVTQKMFQLCFCWDKKKFFFFYVEFLQIVLFILMYILILEEITSINLEHGQF